MSTKKVGIIFGMENTFPPALVEKINSMKAEGVSAVEEGLAFGRRVFALHKFALAGHGDAAFAGVAPSGSESEVGLLKVATTGASGNSYELEFGANVAGSHTFG